MPILSIVPAASKVDAAFNSGKKKTREQSSRFVILNP